VEENQMKKHDMYIPGVLSIQPKIFEDERGYALETFSLRELEEEVGKPLKFVQDFHSHSKKGVLRGLHYQYPRAQGKLVRVTQGEIYDVVVDMRKGSPTFGWWEAEVLNDRNRSMLWVPPGFAHGFLAMSETADVTYRMTNYRYPEDERVLKYNDKTVKVNWPFGRTDPIVSKRDLEGSAFEDSPYFSVENL
jgi:dTDP-4-dehydrorhamnose 3,5-epimerase